MNFRYINFDRWIELLIKYKQDDPSYESSSYSRAIYELTVPEYQNPPNMQFEKATGCLQKKLVFRNLNRFDSYCLKEHCYGSKLGISM